MAAPGVAVPGSVVAIGSQASPAGSQGIQGTSAWTLTTTGFTVPSIGSTATVNVSDTSWAVIGEFVWVATAGGSANAPMALQITAKTGTSLTLLNPPSAGLQPSGDANNLLTLGSDSLLYLPPSAVQPVIWSSRLRSFNSVGNCNFECAQRNIGNTLSNPVHGSFIEDRWVAYNNNALNPAFQRLLVNSGTLTPGFGVILPGTNFTIGSAYMRITCQTVKASLAATDVVGISQSIEGPMLRSLINDVHSVSLLVRSSVANLTFGLSLRDPNSTHSLTKLCTLGPANTITLISLSNIPAWTTSGTFTAAVGSAGYLLSIILACGATYMSPANDTWQNGNFMGALGQANFLANSGATVDVFFVQHEPGQCTTLQDKPFQQNYDEVLRYYQKSYLYGAVIGAVTLTGSLEIIAPVFAGSTFPISSIRFPKIMAKSPTITGYSPATGAVNTVRDQTNAADRAITGPRNAADGGFTGFTITGASAAAALYQYHYTADTGW